MAINKRGEKYVLDWWAGGRRFRKFFDTKTEAKNYRTKEIETKKLDGIYVAPAKVGLFKDAAAAWLAKRVNRRPGTYGFYASRVDKLIARFGDMKLNAITVNVIEKWDGELRKTMAPTSVTAIISILRNVFASAVRAGEIGHNPCDNLERVYNEDRGGDDKAIKPTDILTPAEISTLIEAATPGLYKSLFITAAATGTRSGELFALKWSDIVFDDKPRICIRQSLSRAKGPHDAKTTWRFTDPKTASGVRDIPIDPQTAHTLKLWKLQAGPNPHNLVFPHPSGEPMHRSILQRCGYSPALKKAGLRHSKFHNLRHSYASGLIMHGAKLTEVAARLGHSNPGITARVYSHWFKDADSGASTAYAESIFGADRHHIADK